MQETKELNALFTLIDDPDEEVYTTVSSKIIGYGKGIIPNLENLWETTVSADVQERVEMLIHRLHYTDLTNDIKEWRDSAYHDLLFGALLVLVKMQQKIYAFFYKRPRKTLYMKESIIQQRG